MDTKKMIMISLSIAIVFTQEQLLVFLPNVQLTVLLILLFVSVYSFKESMILITGYVLLDSLYMGGLNPFYLIPMLLSWYLIPVSYHTIMRKTTNEVKLSIFAFAFGFVYGWVFIPFRMVQTGIDELWPYLVADLPFEIIMATTGLLTVLWLFKPLHSTMEQIMKSKKIIASKIY